MLNQNRNGRKPPDRLFVRVFEDGYIGGGYSYCLTPPEGFDSVAYIQVNPEQNECDHIYGLRDVEGFSLAMRSMWDIKQGLKKHRGDENFNYCPLCGERIDWDKIKEKLDDK